MVAVVMPRVLHKVLFSKVSCRTVVLFNSWKTLIFHWDCYSKIDTVSGSVRKFSMISMTVLTYYLSYTYLVTLEKDAIYYGFLIKKNLIKKDDESGQMSAFVGN